MHGSTLNYIDEAAQENRANSKHRKRGKRGFSNRKNTNDDRKITSETPMARKNLRSLYHKTSNLPRYMNAQPKSILQSKANDAFLRADTVSSTIGGNRETIA